MVANKNWDKLHSRGLIPGPGEDEASFLKRATSPNAASCRESLQKIHSLFGMHPDWISVHYSNRGLLPWHGGVTEIEKGVHVQVRKRLESGKALLGIYTPSEIITHEMVHGIRMRFEEPRFEEILAYQTSSSRFRRYFGPLFRSSWESGIFLLSLFSLFLPGFLQWIPAIIGGYGLIRLIRAQHLFSRCLKNLQKLTQKKTDALGFALYLTDREIALFARSTPADILKYAQQQTSLRWQQLRNCHLTFSKNLH